LGAAVSEHSLGILGGEFEAAEISSVGWEQADDVRILVQERNNLCAKRAA